MVEMMQEYCPLCRETHPVTVFKTGFKLMPCPRVQKDHIFALSPKFKNRELVAEGAILHSDLVRQKEPKVKRYALSQEGACNSENCTAQMVESPDGDWVPYATLMEMLNR